MTGKRNVENELWMHYDHFVFHVIKLIAIFFSQDEKARIMRRTIMRYCCLASTMCYTLISPRVKKRFPTLDHLVEAGNFNLWWYLLNNLPLDFNRFLSSTLTCPSRIVSCMLGALNCHLSCLPYTIQRYVYSTICHLYGIINHWENTISPFRQSCWNFLRIFFIFQFIEYIRLLHFW